MGITDTARAKAQASVSEAEANVSKIQSELTEAQAKLKASNTAGGVLDSVEDVSIVGSLTGGLLDKSNVDQSQDQADVDRLTADLSAAQNKLAAARKAQEALVTVVGDD